MEISINTEKLDFTLEKERTLLEVIESLENWLSEQKVVINVINVDGKDLSPEDKEILGGFNINEISNVMIQTSTKIEMALAGLSDAKHYTDTFINELSKSRDEFLLSKDEKIEGLRWVSDVVFTSASVLQVNVGTVFVEETTLEENLAFLILSATELENKKHDNIFFYDYFVGGVKDRLLKLKEFIPLVVTRAMFESNEEDGAVNDDNIKLVLKNLKNDLYNLTPTLGKISENFQSGKDIEALIGIKKISGVLDGLISTLKKVEQIMGLDFKKLEVFEENVDDINKSLLEMLNEVFDAFKNQDMVLLSDLMEYEMGEYFNKYKDVIETLIIISNQKKMVN
jgi:hypothetical protein